MALGYPIGARAPCWQRIPKGTAFPWQWFPKAAALPWREASNGGQSPSGRKNPMKPGFRGTRLCLQSLVCYTFGDRGWRKGVVRGGNKRFQPATEQAGSASSRTRSPGVCFSRIRLFGCRWCGEMERQSAAQPRNGAASPGSQRYIKPAAATHPRYFGNAIVFCFRRSSRSELRISSMALFAYL